MTIKIRGKGKNKLRLEFEEEGYSLLNLLRQKLWENEETDKASYKNEHPYIGNFELLVETESGDPVEALKEAAKGIKKEADEFNDELKSAL